MNPMSPPRIAPKTSIARTPPVTASSLTIVVDAGARIPRVRSTSLRPMTMPVRIANGHANSVNGATTAIAKP